LSFASGVLVVDADDSGPPGDKLRKLLEENEIDLSVLEGLRLFIAFNKLKDFAGRRMLIELAERLAK
jgi:hypothetical protein